MYKEDLALINLQWLISYKTKPNQTKLNQNKTLVSSWCNGYCGGLWNRSKRVRTLIALLSSL